MKSNVPIEGLRSYHVSENGAVTLLTRNRIVLPVLGKDGYFFISLWNKLHKKCKYYRVGRLVALSHIPNPENKPEVNHIDGDTTNDNVLNLEWVTHKENMQHASKIGRMGQTKGRTGELCPLSKPVIGVKDNGEVVEFASAKEADIHFGLPFSSVSRAITQRSHRRLRRVPDIVWNYK